MFSVIRNRFGIPGVLSVIALVFAMAGGAYAAKKYVITSTSQIKPSVLKSLKGNDGPAGPSGKDGFNGTNGSNGTPGAAGKSVESEPAGLECPNGGAHFKIGGISAGSACNGEDGEDGESGFTATLPSEETETGAWLVDEVGEESVARIALSFNIPLEEELEELESFEFVPVGGLSTPDCPGSASSPEAAPGNLCLYAAAQVGSGSEEFSEVASFDPSQGLAPGVGATGAVIVFLTEGAGNEVIVADGSWAVTAP